jgi:hypothetical protein
MTKKISFFVVTVAAVTLVLSGCGNGPGMDGKDMEPDDMPMALPYVGTWHLAGLPVAATVKLEAAEFTITAGDGTAAIGMEAPYNLITMIVVNGNLEVADTAFTLTVPDGGVEATFAPGVTPVQQAGFSAGILAGLQVADDSPVMVTISDDGNSITLQGAFIVNLLNLPDDAPALMACKDMACPADGGTTQ